MTTATLYHLAVNYDLPSYVKTADLNELAADDLCAQAYADVNGKQFPLHTKAACVFSAAQVADLPESPLRARCIERVKRAAAAFDVERDVENVLQPKPIAPDRTMFAWHDGNRNALPIKTATDMEASTQWLLEQRPGMSLATGRPIAQAIVKRAEETGVVLTRRAELYRLAGAAAPDLAGIKKACEWRAGQLKPRRPDIAAQLLKIANMEFNGPCNMEAAGVIANTLDGVDDVHGLRHLYKQGMPLPEAVYGDTAEQLSELKESMCVTTSGDVFDKYALAQIPTGELAGWMGEGFLSKSAADGALCPDLLTQAVESLSRQDANRFAKLAETVGIKPIGRVTPSQPLVV